MIVCAAQSVINEDLHAAENTLLKNVFELYN